MLVRLILIWIIVLRSKSRFHIGDLSTSISLIMNKCTTCFLLTSLRAVIILTRKSFIFLISNISHHVGSLSMGIHMHHGWHKLLMMRHMPHQIIIMLVSWRWVGINYRWRLGSRSSCLIHLLHFFQVDL